MTRPWHPHMSPNPIGSTSGRSPVVPSRNSNGTSALSVETHTSPSNKWAGQTTGGLMSPGGKSGGLKENEEISSAMYAQLQAERASVDLRLHNALQEVEAYSRKEKMLEQQLLRERQQANETIQRLASALDSVRGTVTDDQGRDVTPPRGASGSGSEEPARGSPQRSAQLESHLRDAMNSPHRDTEQVAIAAAQAATAKVEELTQALFDKEAMLETANVRITTLEERIAALTEAHCRQVCSLEDEIRELRVQVDGLNTRLNSLQAALPQDDKPDDAWPPSPRRGQIPDDPPSAPAVVSEAPRHNAPRPPSPPPASRGPAPVPRATPEKHRQEWPPSPRRAHIPMSITKESPDRDSLDNTCVKPPSMNDWTKSPPREPEEPCTPDNLNDTLPTITTTTRDGWGTSLRRELNTSQESAQSETREWPPSPRRAHDEGKEWTRSPRRVRGGVTDSDDVRKEWPPSPRRSREVAEEGRKEWPPSPRRSREVAEEGRKEWPPSPRRSREVEEGRKEWPPTPRREDPPATAQPKEWPPSPRREQREPTVQPLRGEEPPSPRRTYNIDEGIDSMALPAMQLSKRADDSGMTLEGDEDIIERQSPAWEDESAVLRPSTVAAASEGKEWPPSPRRHRDQTLNTSTDSVGNLSADILDRGTPHTPSPLLEEVGHKRSWPGPSPKRQELSEPNRAHRLEERTLSRRGTLPPPGALAVRQLTNQTSILGDDIVDRAQHVFSRALRLCSESTTVVKEQLLLLMDETGPGALILLKGLVPNMDGRISLDEWIRWLEDAESREVNGAVDRIDWVGTRLSAAEEREYA